MNITQNDHSRINKSGQNITKSIKKQVNLQIPTSYKDSRWRPQETKWCVSDRVSIIMDQIRVVLVRVRITTQAVHRIKVNSSRLVERALRLVQGLPG